MNNSPARLTVGQSLALGALHGPTELLPVSSSGHTTVIPWLLGSRYAELDPELRKALEVALHIGATAAMLIARRRELMEELRRLDRDHLLVVAAGTAPAGVIGLVLERGIEARLGTPATIATGLILGGLAMLVADQAPSERRADQARAVDGLWLGLAQALALVPGVSRNGATVAAARARRFRRADAALLSRQLAFPVVTGATLLKAWRLRQRSALRRHGPPLAAGAAASFTSTLLATALTREGDDDRRLLAFAVYRVGLGTLVIARLKRGSKARTRPPARY